MQLDHLSMTDPNHGSQDTTQRIANDQAFPNQTENIHRKLGTAGIRLNEAHGHLSTLQSNAHDNSEAAAEILEAESTALVRTLEDVQDQIEEAINLAVIASEQFSEGDDSESAQRVQSLDSGSGMLWNTVSANQLSDPSKSN